VWENDEYILYITEWIYTCKWNTACMIKTTTNEYSFGILQTKNYGNMFENTVE